VTRTQIVTLLGPGRMEAAFTHLTLVLLRHQWVTVQRITQFATRLIDS